MCLCSALDPLPPPPPPPTGSILRLVTGGDMEMNVFTDSMTSFRYHSILSRWAKCQSHARYRTWLHVRVVSHLCTRRTEYGCHRHAQCHERALTITPHNDVHSDSPEYMYIMCMYVYKGTYTCTKSIGTLVSCQPGIHFPSVSYSFQPGC